MDKKPANATPELTEEDLREALRELKTYVDITEEDLKKIYTLALNHARQRLVQNIPVRAVMTTTVVTVSKDADLHEASRLLADNRISGMPVVDERHHVVGVISEADLLALAGMKREHTFKDVLRHLLGEPLPSQKKGARVGDVMSTPAIFTGPDADIRSVAAILDERRIKRLPVVDAAQKLVGVISRADIVRAMGRK